MPQEQPAAAFASTAPAPGLSPAARQRLAGLAWAAVTVCIFSGWFVVTRFSVTRELRVWDVTALRFGIGTLLLAPAVLLPGRRLSRAAWLKGLLFACLWGMPFVICVALGLQLTSAARAASIAPTLMPVFAGVFGFLFLRERPSAMRWLGYIAILGGLVALVSAGAAPPDPLGLLALVSASAMWAVYTLLFRRSGLDAAPSAALICIWSAILFLPVYLGFGLSRLGAASSSEIVFQALYQGVLMSAVAVVTFNRAVSLLGAAAATAIIALIPAVASLFAVPVLGEVPTLAEAAAIAAIVAGVLFAARAPARPPVSKLSKGRP